MAQDLGEVPSPRGSLTAVLAVRTLSSPWDTTFSELVETATSDLLLLSPYISRRPLDALLTIISRRNRLATIHLQVVTDLSAASLAAETIDVAGLQRVLKEVPNACLTHLPRLHAKVYIADGRLAVVTSGNLTEGGLSRNYEFGLRIHDRALVSEIKGEAQAYARLGGDVSQEALADIRTTADTLVALRKRAERDVNQTLKQALKAQSRLAELKLLHVRAQGKTTHGILADTLLYLLRSGPRTTVDLHRMVQHIHPDICDDSVDRVIDGVHFGKKWKHYVRTAQQHLKKKALVAHEHGRWYRTSGSGP